MIKAAIAIDRWKLDIFDKHLKRDGFRYDQKFGITPDTLILAVMADSAEALAPTVKRANDECARMKDSGFE